MDTPADLLAALIAALSLTPAEGATEVTPDQILAKIDELVTAAGTADETGSELERLRAENLAFTQAEEGRLRQAGEAAADEALAQFTGTPEAKAALREMFLTNQDAALAILNGLPTPPEKSAPAAEEPPPAPMHKEDDDDAEELTPEQKATEAKKLIEDLRKARPQAFPTFESARNEIRRQRPELFEE